MRGREKRAKEEKTYPLWENCRIAFSKWARVMGVRYPLATLGSIGTSVLQPFAAMALPGAVVGLLGSGWPPEAIFLSIAGYVLALQLLQIVRNYLARFAQNGRFLFRWELGAELFEAVLSADFQKLESARGQRKMEGARENIYYGNEIGIEAFLRAFENFGIALTGLLLYAAFIGRMNYWVLFLLLAFSGITMAANVYADRRSIRHEEAYARVSQGYEYLKREVLVPANGKDIRLYRMWDWFRREFGRMAEELTEWTGRQKNCVIHASLFEKALSALRDLLVYAYLIRQMALGRMEPAEFLLYMGIVAGFGGWITSLRAATGEVLKNNRYMNRYRDFLEFSGERPGGKESVENPGKVHEIRLEHVSFRYEGKAPFVEEENSEEGRTSGEERTSRGEKSSGGKEYSGEDAVHDLSLTIRPGEKIALVGRNGAGKSTLIKLICGLYRPSSGRIYLDGRDISLYSPEAYRREFAVVFQEVFAFAFPLADNVSCKAAEETDQGRLEESLRDAGLWERVQELPKRERTNLNKDLDPGGVALSGGELQRLMLARALYKDAPIVILDEPTAALDPLAESAMYEKYHEMTRNKTSIFISHRLSSTKFCSRILYMEKGRIAEEGSHEELMEKQGNYAAMFRTQAQYYERKAVQDREKL